MQLFIYYLLLFYFHLIADVNLKNLYIIRAINQYLPIFIENVYIILEILRKIA